MENLIKSFRERNLVLQLKQESQIKSKTVFLTSMFNFIHFFAFFKNRRKPSLYLKLTSATKCYPRPCFLLINLKNFRSLAVDNLRIAVSRSSKKLAVTELIFIDKASDTSKIFPEIRSSLPAVLCKNE